MDVGIADKYNYLIIVVGDFLWPCIRKSMLWFDLHHNIQVGRPNFYDEQPLEVVPAF